MKVCILTLGCKINQYESAEIAHILRGRGYEVCEKFCHANCYVVNTCAVTSFAEKKSRYEVARLLRKNPSAKIIVCGCASELNRAQFCAFSPSAIFGCDKNEVADKVDEVLGLTGVKDVSKERDTKANKSDKSNACVFSGMFDSNHTRQFFIKVQTGCNNFCSYCIVPYLRGRSKSRQLDEIIETIRAHSQGREVVLTGIDLSSYGLDIGLSLAALCSKVNEVGQPFHMSSLEVRVISDEFLEVLSKCENFRPLFHLSLQSGDDEVLKAMNRHYSVDDFASAVANIRKHFPNAVITTDIICGFPTETDANFLATCDFVRRINFDDVHVFPYSVREGTHASKMKQVKNEVITKRAETLRALVEDVKMRKQNKAPLKAKK